MSGWHLLPPSWTSGATASDNSHATTSLTGANLLLHQPSFKWRAAGVTSLQITLDAGSAKAWDTLFLGYHNGTSSGTIRVTSNASTGTLFSSPSYDSTALGLTFSGDLSAFSENHSWIATGSTHTFRYVGIEINDASNPDGYFQAGVVVVGQLWSPPMGAELGLRFGRYDPSEEISLVNSETIKRTKRGQDRGRWAFPMQSETQVFANWMPIHLVYGSHSPMVVKRDPLVSGYDQYGIIYGYGQWPEDGPITYTKHSAGVRYHDVEFGMREL